MHVIRLLTVEWVLKIHGIQPDIEGGNIDKRGKKRDQNENNVKRPYSSNKLNKVEGKVGDRPESEKPMLERSKKYSQASADQGY